MFPAAQIHNLFTDPLSNDGPDDSGLVFVGRSPGFHIVGCRSSTPPRSDISR
jgi:hypothetical protein